MGGNGQNDSALVAIGIRDNRIILDFPQPVKWLALDPDNSIAICEEICRRAYEVKYNKPYPMATRSLVAENMRKKLHARATLMIRSMIEQRRKADYIAHRVVDQLLKEIT